MKEHTYKNIGGWFNFTDIYSQMVKNAENGAYFVEIGTCLGKSASFMGVEIHNSGKNITFDTIDTFKGSPTEIAGKHKFFTQMDVYERAKYHLKDLPVNIVVSDSVKAAKNYKNKSLDFVFIDGAHTYDAVLKDIKAYIKKVKPGGYIAGHDYDNANVYKAVATVIGADCPVGINSWLYQLPL